MPPCALMLVREDRDASRRNAVFMFVGAVPS